MFRVYLIRFFHVYLALTFAGGNAYANATTELEKILMAFEEMSYTPHSKVTITKLLDEAKPFLNDDNSEQLSAHYAKAQHYLYFIENLDDCSNDSRQLGQRYLDQASLQARCRYNTDLIDQDFNQFKEDLDDIASSVTNKEIHLNFLDKLADQAVLSLKDHRLRYGLNSKLPTAKELCAQGSIARTKQCSDTYKEKLQEKLDSISPNPPKLSSYNQLLNELNWLLDDYKWKPEKFKDKLLIPPGSLLLSDTIQNELGSLDSEKSYKKLTIDVLKKAIEEIDNDLIAMMKDLGKRSLYKNDDAIRKSIKSVMKSSPHLIGAELVNKPEYANHLCQLMRDIEEDDDSDEAFYKWGGMIVAGVAVVGTIATLGAGGVLFFAGASALTTGVLATGSLALSASGIGAAGLFSAQAVSKYNETKAFESSLMIGVSDKQGVDELSEALEEFYHLRTQAVLSLGFSLIPGGGLKFLTKTAELKAYNNLVKNILNNNKLVKKIKEYQEKFGTNSTRELIVKLLGMPLNKSIERLTKLDIRKLPSWIYTNTKEFKDSVTNVPSFFLRTKTKPDEDRMARVYQTVINPVGSLSGKVMKDFQIRDHLTFFTYPVLGLVTSMRLEGDNAKIYQERAAKRKDTVMGGAYLEAIRELGGLDDNTLNHLLYDHDMKLLEWEEDSVKNPLPRIKKLIEKKIITKDDEKALTGMAKRVYDKVAKGFADFDKQKRKEQKENKRDVVGASFSEYLEFLLNAERAKNPEFENKEIYSNLTNYMYYLLNQMITKSPRFKTKSPFHQQLLSEYFYPLLDFGTRTDIDLKIIIQESFENKNKKDSIETDTDLKDYSIDLVVDNVVNNKIDYIPSLLMVNTILNNPTAVREKFDTIKKIVPPEKAEFGLMPDTPRKKAVSKIIKPEKEINSDTDLWEVFMNDKRFMNVKDAFLNDYYTAEEVRIVGEFIITNYNDGEAIYQNLISEDRLPTDIELTHLYGLDGQTTPNQLLQSYAEEIQYMPWKIEEDNTISEETRIKINKCLKVTTKHWLEFLSKEAEFANDEKFLEKREELNLQYQEKYQTILKNCL